MIDWRFLFFTPRNNFLTWKAEFNMLWIITIFFAVGLIWVYYFFLQFKIENNRKMYWYVGIFGSFLWLIIAFIYLQFIKPIPGSNWQDAVTAAFVLFLWLFVFWYLIVATIPRYLFGWFIRIKKLGNGFLHKRRIPW